MGHIGTVESSQVAAFGLVTVYVDTGAGTASAVRQNGWDASDCQDWDRVCEWLRGLALAPWYEIGSTAGTGHDVAVLVSESLTDAAIDAVEAEWIASHALDPRRFEE